MLELVSEDKFDWYFCKVGHVDSVEERYREPEWKQASFAKFFSPEQVEEMMQKRPWDWNRKIFRDSETGLFFIFLAHSNVYINVGFLSEAEVAALDAKSFLPHFHLGYVQVDARSQDEACEMFVAGMEKLVPAYLKREAQQRPIKSELKARLRDVVKKYALLTGSIDLPSKLTVVEKNGRKTIFCSMKCYREDNKCHVSDWCFYDVDRLKETGLWPFSEEQEQQLIHGENRNGRSTKNGAQRV